MFHCSLVREKHRKRREEETLHGAFFLLLIEWCKSCFRWPPVGVYIAIAVASAISFPPAMTVRILSAIGDVVCVCRIFDNFMMHFFYSPCREPLDMYMHSILKRRYAIYYQWMYGGAFCALDNEDNLQRLRNHIIPRIPVDADEGRRMATSNSRRRKILCMSYGCDFAWCAFSH